MLTKVFSRPTCKVLRVVETVDSVDEAGEPALLASVTVRTSWLQRKRVKLCSELVLFRKCWCRCCLSFCCLLDHDVIFVFHLAVCCLRQCLNTPALDCISSSATHARISSCMV